jgi:DNA processing protein
MDTQELAAWLRLTLTPGVGNDTARRLLAAFGMPQAVFEQSASALKQVVSAAQTKALQTPAPELAALLQTTQTWVASAPSHHVLTLGDPHYPPSLLAIEDPPLMLYMLSAHVESARAAINSIANNVAVVGSRNPTPQGAASAEQLAQALATAGVNIVSGLALGIDGAAHRGALASGSDGSGGGSGDGSDGGQHTGCGITIAVVGTGLDRVYPKQHRDLAHQMAQRGLILSEFPLGTPPLTQNFPKRNRLIAGLARATLVVEAALQSGSLITARCALEQGKDIFAVPGSIHSPQSRGCHALIKQGAKLVETAQDVLEELHGLGTIGILDATKSIAARADSTPASSQFDHQTDAPTAPHNHSQQHPLLAALGFAPCHLDALQARTGLDTASLQAQLLELELTGQVARLPGGLFQQVSAG